MNSELAPWTCRTCGRRVPRYVGACRCGGERPPAAMPSDVASEHPRRPPGFFRSAGVRVVAAAIGLAAGAVLLFWFATGREAPVQPNVQSVSPSQERAAPHAVSDAPTPTPGTQGADASRITPVPQPADLPVETLSEAIPSIEDLVAVSGRSVVSVRAPDRSGSGFYVTRDLILTNEHVVTGERSVNVTLNDGTRLLGHVVFTNPDVDIALVRVPASRAGQEALPLGSGRAAKAGQEVLAIGAAFGLANTVTRGIVSAVRTEGGVTFVQTDAAINPGSSGGPLIDRQGRVIGITTLRLTPTVAESIGFAVAIDHAIDLLEGRAPIGGGAPSGRRVGTPTTRADAPKPPAEPRSELDVMRDRAGAAFGAQLAQLSRAADNLDVNFRRYLDACYGKATTYRWTRESAGVAVGTAAGSVSGRNWFVLWENEAAFAWAQFEHGEARLDNETTVVCRALWSDIASQAASIRRGLETIEDIARRMAIYPGVMRELRARYRLDYSF